MRSDERSTQGEGLNVEAAVRTTGTTERGSRDHERSKVSAYVRFGAMIASSMAAMFVLTYVTTYEWDHVHWSETRFYMTFVMGAAMAVIMLGFMLRMYKDVRANAAIVVASVVVFAVALFLVRSQATIDDTSYMKAMIPHHSIAILTSSRAQIDDLRVRALADGIIEAQRREIREMDWLIADIAKNGKATSRTDANARPVPDMSGGRPEEAG